MNPELDVSVPPGPGPRHRAPRRLSRAGGRGLLWWPLTVVAALAVGGVLAFALLAQPVDRFGSRNSAALAPPPAPAEPPPAATAPPAAVPSPRGPVQPPVLPVSVISGTARVTGEKIEEPRPAEVEPVPEEPEPEQGEYPQPSAPPERDHEEVEEEAKGHGPADDSRPWWQWPPYGSERAWR